MTTIDDITIVDAPSRVLRTALLDRDVLDADTRALTFTASTTGVKRDGIDLQLEGLETDAYETNPVFLWAHDYSGRTLPIGKVTKLRKLKNRMDVVVEFDQDDDFARQVEQKYRDGFLNAVSIGWNILEWRRGVESDGEDPDLFIVTRSDLLDVSAVPVPGDPTALIKTQREFLARLGAELLETLEDVEPVDGTQGVVDAGDEDDITIDDAMRRVEAAVEAIEASTDAVDRATQAIEDVTDMFRDALGDEIPDDTTVVELSRIRDALNKENQNHGR